MLKEPAAEMKRLFERVTRAANGDDQTHSQKPPAVQDSGQGDELRIDLWSFSYFVKQDLRTEARLLFKKSPDSHPYLSTVAHFQPAFSKSRSSLSLSCISSSHTLFLITLLWSLIFFLSLSCFHPSPPPPAPLPFLRTEVNL